jgi:hypothetical protein
MQQEFSEKNKFNRAKDLIHPATGSRSYVVHLENVVNHELSQHKTVM